MPRASTEPDCDLLIIGGGINGLGVAVDATGRGLSVVLAERGDFGCATTSASSRLIHGGLRYLRYGELGMVRESLRERGRMVRARPHRVRPIELLIPVYCGQRPGPLALRAGLRLYELLARDRLFPRPRALSVAETVEREPGLAREGLEAGFVYPDAQVEYPERFCVELALEARAAGADLRNHTAVVALMADAGRVVGASLRDQGSGRETTVRARAVLNAAGPWVDAVNALLPSPPPPLLRGVWGSHLVLPRRDAGPRGPLYAAAAADGRPLFLLPWSDRLLLGTTEVPLSGDPDAAAIQEWEVDYLLAEANRLFPGADYTYADIQHRTIGIRPLPRGRGSSAATTRRHFVVDHRRDGAPGLFSLVGGKLTTYRSFAEDAVNRIERELRGRVTPCPSRSAPPPDPGWEGRFAELAASVRLPGALRARLARVYGPSVVDLALAIQGNPSLAEPVAPGCPAVMAEVERAITHEQARSVEDVLLRRLVLIPPSDAARERVGRLLAEGSTGPVETQAEVPEVCKKLVC